jgi:hypothetical protein
MKHNPKKAQILPTASVKGYFHLEYAIIRVMTAALIVKGKYILL